jgi:hypothetical protein
MLGTFQEAPCAPCFPVVAVPSHSARGWPVVAGEAAAAPPPTAADFSLQVTPGSLQIPAGGSGFATVTLAGLNGFTADVTLSGIGIPTDVVTGSTIPAGVTTLQLPLTVAPEASPSAYAALSLRGQAGTLSHDPCSASPWSRPCPPATSTPTRCRPPGAGSPAASLSTIRWCGGPARPHQPGRQRRHPGAPPP